MRVVSNDNEDAKAARFRAMALPCVDDVYSLARYLLGNTADAEDAGATVSRSPTRTPIKFPSRPGGRPIPPGLLIPKAARIDCAGRDSVMPAPTADYRHGRGNERGWI